MAKRKQVQGSAPEDFPSWLWDGHVWQKFIDDLPEFDDYLLSRNITDEHQHEFFRQWRAKQIVSDLRREALSETTVCPPCARPTDFLHAHGFRYGQLREARAQGLVV